MDESHQLYQTARAHMEEKDFARAIEALEKSAALAPHFKTLELLGECHVSLGQLREAVAPLAAATTLNNQARAPSLLADAFCRLGETSQAFAMARLALARSPTNKIALGVIQKLEHLDEPAR